MRIVETVTQPLYQAASDWDCFADKFEPSFRRNFLIHNCNRTEWSPIRSVIIWVMYKIGRPRSGRPICLITSVITERLGQHELLLPINHNRYNFQENECIFFLVQQRWNTKCPKLGKISLAETLSNVTNSSILENPQFGMVSGCCCGYCDNFCDWWI